MPDPTTRDLLILDLHGTFKVTIPADWKVTFAGFNPAAPHSELGHALRIYESRDKQRACFTNVVAFRDLSLPVERVVEKDGKQVWEADETGFGPTDKIEEMF